MYTTRARLVTFNSLRNLLQVCRLRTSLFPNSVCSVRNLSIATERSDFHNSFDGSVAENQLGYNNFDRNESFHSRNLGVAEQNQNPSRVYGQRLNEQVGIFTGESSDSYNGLGGIRSSGNHPDYNDGNRNNQFWNKNLVGVEQSQNYSGFHGQNASLNGPNNGRVVGITQQDSRGQFFAGKVETLPTNFRGGPSNGSVVGITHQDSRGQFFAGKVETLPTDFCGNQAETTGMSQPSLHNAGMHQQNGNGICYSNQGKYNETSVDAFQGNRMEREIEDLDELTKAGKLEEAVELLKLLNQEGLQVNLPRYIALMKLCGDNAALEEAKTIHDYVVKSTPNIDVRTSNKILEMYSKCGSMGDAFAVFDKMPQRNLTSWDIMISGLAKNSLGENSIELFEEFKRSGLKPDAQIFIGVFSACGVLCDTIEGMLHFESMRKDYGIVPSMDHYVGMVDMFGSAGCLDEALEFIENMPFEPNVDVWETLMKLCRIHGNVELGDRCAEQVQLIDSSKLNDQSREGLIPINASDIEKEKVKHKLSGQNLLDVRNRVHEYRAGDKSHPDHEKIYALLRGLKQQMKELGYVPETKFVLHDVDDESKEEALMAHSERLAAAKGFMTSAPRSDLRIIKNLRVCGDCHKAFKIISKIVGRAIIARDCKRFHHFENGSCSCNDFW